MGHYKDMCAPNWLKHIGEEGTKIDFINKLNDAESENTETQAWFDFSHDCNYIS